MTILSTDQVKRVAIIGAGPSGLAAAKYLAAEKSISDITIYEQRPGPGGVWVATPTLNSPSYTMPQTLPESTPPLPPKEGSQNGQEGTWQFQSAVYDYLETNIPTMLMKFSDLGFPDGTPLFPPHSVVKEYLDAYAEDVLQMIRFGTQVLDVKCHRYKLERGEEYTEWHVKSKTISTDKEETAVFDAVVVANGHHDRAYIPDIKGILDWHRTYPGSVIHSKDYKRPENYEGKKVVIVGAGVSGTDIANQIAPHAQHPLLLSKRAPKGSSSPLPPENTSIEDLTEVVEFVARNRTIHFSDGRTESDVDAVIFCTGYLYSYPFLQDIKPAVATTGNRTENLYLHIFYHEEPTLVFLVLPVRIVPFIMAEIQSAVVARFFAGRLALPPLSERREWEEQRLEEKGPGKPFHFMGYPDDAEYLDKLANLAEMASGEDDGQGRKAPRWRHKDLWIRENSSKIVASVRGLDSHAREKIKTLEDAGFYFEVEIGTEQP